MKINDKEIKETIKFLTKKIESIKKNIRLNKKYIQKEELKNLTENLNKEKSFEEEYLFYKEFLFEKKLKFKNFGKWYEEPLYKVGRIYAKNGYFKNNPLNTQNTYKKDDLIISLNKNNYLFIKYAKEDGILKENEIKFFSIFCYKDFIFKYFEYFKNTIIKNIFINKNDYVEIMKGVIFVPEIEEQEQIAVLLDLLKIRLKMSKHI